MSYSAMQDDRTYTRVLGFTELGILEMTRKRKSILYGTYY